jgi:hypothetical protein
MVLLLAGAAYALTPSMAGAMLAAPTPEQQVSWAVVEIAKPTATPTVVPSPTPIPPTPEPVRPSPTETQPLASIAPTSAAPQDMGSVPPSGKYILVSIHEQHLYAYQDGQLAYSFIVSTGSGNSTRTGTFHILDKIPNAWGADWNFWMPDWLGIYWVGDLENGIHALPLLPGGGRLWGNSLGSPASYGCVVLGVDDAAQIFNWADVGTTVRITP